MLGDVHDDRMDETDDDWPRLNVVRSDHRDRWVLAVAVVLLASIMIGTIATLF